MFLPPVGPKVSMGSLASESAAQKTYASLCGTGILASTLLISAAPKPVAVRLCLGREMPSGPTGPWRSVMGADEDGLLSRVRVAMIGYEGSMGGKGGRKGK